MRDGSAGNKKGYRETTPYSLNANQLMNGQRYVLFR